MSSYRKCRSAYRKGEERSGTIKDYSDNVIVKVGSRQLITSSDVLIRHSTVFAQQIQDEGRRRKSEERFCDIREAETYLRCLQQNAGPQEVVITKFGYSDVKLLLSILKSSDSKRTELTVDNALKILPMVSEYNLSRIRRQCEKRLLEDLDSKKPNNGGRHTKIDILLTYLAAADAHDLRDLKKRCILLYSTHTDSASRQLLVSDEHISENTKVKLFAKLCETLDTKYTDNLDKLQKEIRNRYEDLENKRKEMIEETNEWRSQLNEEYDKVVKALLTAHDDLEQQIKENMIKFGQSVTLANKPLIEKCDAIQHIVQEDIDAESSEDVGSRAQIQQAQLDKMEEIKQEVKSLKVSCKESIHMELNCYCRPTEEIEQFLSDNYELYERLDQLGAELEVKTNALAEMEVKLEQEKLEHDKTNAALQKWTGKVHKINTWVRWAKPPSDNQSECSCFRHSDPRRFVQT